MRRRLCFLREVNMGRVSNSSEAKSSVMQRPTGSEIIKKSKAGGFGVNSFVTHSCLLPGGWVEDEVALCVHAGVYSGLIPKLYEIVAVGILLSILCVSPHLWELGSVSWSLGVTPSDSAVKMLSFHLQKEQNKSKWICENNSIAWQHYVISWAVLHVKGNFHISIYTKTVPVVSDSPLSPMMLIHLPQIKTETFVQSQLLTYGCKKLTGGSVREKEVGLLHPQPWLKDCTLNQNTYN